jgi:hypothetical protein
MAAALMAPMGFLAAGALWPGYSHTAQTVSELVARHAPNRLPLSIFFVAYNSLLAGFGLALRDLAREWERTRNLTGRYGIMSGNRVILLSALGLMLLVLPMDPSDGGRTLTGVAHMIVAGLMAAAAWDVALSAGLWLRPASGLQDYGRFSLVAAAAMALFGVLTFFALRLGLWAGLMERLIIGAYEVWMFVMARKFYHLTTESGRWSVVSNQ